MPGIEWSEQYATMVGSIDGQHRRLFDLINDFYAVPPAQRMAQGMQALLDGLLSYARFHFQTEEALMVKHGYPDAVRHAAEHRRFTEKARALAEAHDQDRLRMSFEVTDFLRDWLANHIRGSDRRMGEYLAERGVH